MKRTSLFLFAVLVIVGCLSNEQLTAAQQPATPPQSQPASQAGPIPDKPRTVVIPAGSVITVRLESPLDPSSKTGDVFTAVVTGLIAVGGEVVVPAGVAARGQVIGVKANKKATEKARLKLALTSLTIDGTTYSIQTKLVNDESSRQDQKHKRDHEWRSRSIGRVRISVQTDCSGYCESTAQWRRRTRDRNTLFKKNSAV